MMEHDYRHREPSRPGRAIARWAGAAVALLSLTAVTPGFGQAPPNPQQAAQQADQLGRSVIADLPELQEVGKKAVKDLEKLKDSPGLKSKLKELEKKGDEAKAKAGRASHAADMAEDRVLKCQTEADKKRCEKAIADAEAAAKSAEAALDDVEAAKGKVKADAEQLDKAANDAFSGRRQQIAKAMAAAKDAGLSPQGSAGVSRLQDAETKLDDELVKQLQRGDSADGTPQGNLSKINDLKKEIDGKVDDAAGDATLRIGLRRAKATIEAAKAKLKDCPPKTGALAPQQPTDVYVNFPDQAQTNVCIASGQDVGKAVNALGLADSQVVASTSQGTVVRTTTDAKTVEKAAQDKKVDLCFKPESDFCIIFTPLTRFRGHDHAAHAADPHRGPHDHDGPDPPFDWGVTPPTPAVTLEVAP